MTRMKDPINPSLTSRYGYGASDVRATYAHLPCQWFWTWLTGKALPSGPPRKPQDTLMSVPRFVMEIVKTWGILFSAMALGVWVQNAFLKALCIVVVMNRTRKVIHMFHYTTHGASIADKRLAQVLAKYFLSIPILHTTWGEYQKIHIRDHHAHSCLSTDADPDQQFVIDHGFKPRMTEREFWYAVFVESFKPRHVWNHIAFRLKHNFIYPGWDERLPRIAFWVWVCSTVTYFGIWPEFALYYLFPLLVLTQWSSYIQHITEHLWFAPPRGRQSPKQHMASLTWGRFLGRPYPRMTDAPDVLHGVGRLAVWWLKVFLVDLPFRVFVFMQDLSSHDFHHRLPGVCFRSIAKDRANTERTPGPFGPMTETWSVWEAILIVRDHVVHSISEPFISHHPLQGAGLASAVSEPRAGETRDAAIPLT